MNLNAADEHPFKVVTPTGDVIYGEVVDGFLIGNGFSLWISPCFEVYAREGDDYVKV